MEEDGWIPMMGKCSKKVSLQFDMMAHFLKKGDKRNSYLPLLVFRLWVFCSNTQLDGIFIMLIFMPFFSFSLMLFFSFG